MRTARRLATASLSTAALVAAIAVAPASAQSPERPAYEPDWAPASEADVHPGTQVYTDGSQCTSNFIFADVDTDPVTNTETLGALYIGMAAHCSGTDGNTSTNGCEAGSLPLGTPVEIDGATADGVLAYNSWLAMQETGETDQNRCRGNDFALVEIDPADYAITNPSLPYWGGPHGVNTEGVSIGEDLYSFGNSGLRLGIETLSPKVETKAATNNGGWTHVTYAVSPGVPGDSGSGHVDSQGRAFGVTSTLILSPYPAGNGIVDLGRALEYARAHTGQDLRLVDGTEDFVGAL